MLQTYKYFRELLHTFFFGTTVLKKELRETESLYRRVAKLHSTSQISLQADPFDMACFICAGFIKNIPADLTGRFLAAVRDILALENMIFTLPEIEDFACLSMKEGMELRNLLRSKEWFHRNEEKVIIRLGGCLTWIFETIAKTIPDISVPSPFVIPVIYTLPDPKDSIENICNILFDERYVDSDLFSYMRRRVHANLDEVKIPATKMDASLSKIVTTYLGGTPFEDFFASHVPLRLTHEERFAHMHIVGGSGAGKTQLLQSLILHDLQSEEAPGLIIVDSQTDLIDNISHLALFKDRRLILITPKDIEYPPALNIFDVNRSRFGNYDALAKEQVTAGVIETFDYLFTGLLGADLTTRQSLLFRYIARLMLAIPETMGRNATILDMMYLMDDVEPYREAIQSLSEIPRSFFVRDFPTKTFEQTKEQIRYRLQAIIENPTLARLFTSPSTKIDLFDELNRGSVILVDTARDFLKGSSSHFGRIFIALTLQAVLERAAIPEEQRRPAFLYVDEAAAYFDNNIDDLLTETRKYKLGCCFAHQYLEQCTPSLKASLAANTASKLAAGVSTSDARSLAPDMRTTHDFILSQPKLHFACHIRNVTPQAVSIPIEYGRLEKEPRLSADEYDDMRARSREQVSLGPSRPPPPAPEPSPPEAPPEPKGPATALAPPVVARRRRKRPKKPHVPLVGDIDTSA